MAKKIATIREMLFSTSSQHIHRPYRPSYFPLHTILDFPFIFRVRFGVCKSYRIYKILIICIMSSKTKLDSKKRLKDQGIKPGK